MKKTIWEEREKAFEDKYFRDLEQEQLRKLREKNMSRNSADISGDENNRDEKDKYG